MFPDNNLDFIRTRIYEIRTALMYSLSENIIKMPTSLISVLKVDDKGQIWFLMNRPSQAMEKSELRFPARLQFYRKGKPFHMQISGQASVVEEIAALNHLFSGTRTVRKVASNNLMVVKLKMSSIEYHEYEKVKKVKNPVGKVLQYLYASLFVPSNSYQALYNDQLNKLIPNREIQNSVYS